MIVKSNLHTSGSYLAQYMTAQKKNEVKPEVFVIHGTPFNDDIKLAVEWMDSFKKGTRAKKAIEHIQICPQPGIAMTPADWQTSIDIALTKKKYVNSKGQFRAYAAVPHTKVIDGVETLHMHVAVMRFNPETGKMNTCSNSYLDNDAARGEMEEVLGHPITQQRNPKHKIIQEQLSDLWLRARDGKEFKEGVEALGYKLALGGHKKALRVVDEKRDYPLVEKVQPVYVKGETPGQRVKENEVWDRLRGLDLGAHTEVIKSQRAKHKAAEKKKIIEEQKVYSPDSRPPKERVEVGKPAAEKKPGPSQNKEVVEFDISKKQNAFEEALEKFKEEERKREERERKIKEMMDNLEAIRARSKDKGLSL